MPEPLDDRRVASRCSPAGSACRRDEPVAERVRRPLAVQTEHRLVADERNRTVAGDELAELRSSEPGSCRTPAAASSTPSTSPLATVASATSLYRGRRAAYSCLKARSSRASGRSVPRTRDHAVSTSTSSNTVYARFRSWSRVPDCADHAPARVDDDGERHAQLVRDDVRLEGAKRVLAELREEFSGRPVLGLLDLAVDAQHVPVQPLSELGRRPSSSRRP